MDITLKQLQVFVAITQHGTLAAAADQLFMTKGAASQNLAQLEARLEQPLFDRYRGRLLLNEQGRQLQPKADELLVRSREIQSLFSQSSQLLRVGSSKTTASRQLPELLGQFSQQQGWLPRVTIENSQTLFAKLRSFELDIAMVEAPTRDPMLHQQAWFDDEMVVIAARSHPLATHSLVSFAQLAQESWILREQGSGSRDFFEQQLAPLIDYPAPLLEVDSLETLRRCVIEQLGLSFASRQLVECGPDRDALAVIECPKRFIRTLYLCYHRDKYLGQNIQTWLQLALAYPKSAKQSQNNEQ
ncbi:LysR substrate-binding domain-containing protein [Celerinatantimonas diazotrophica]|uniref:DNA-binding transcriptional LysR family regulator n=1 Tax=Celerinatantimonas diazotrophica TaxID=412034 RepID=A0A4R1KF49_9GAMM|nr:LysR substrate-binding domain-containing protein [Celerinatantimonas diazotrophica]TCK63305.1 DNA-binding transcriptional LysR family regulator [Celerinatantimonas diazotrophica]CAG9298449.1 HTH-type transcriptional activator CmpR [Celerinatantimonas diazotrophica]